MSLSYTQIKQLAIEVSSKLIGKNLSRVTEQSYRKFIFDFGDQSLLFCFQDPFLRFHLTNLRGGEEKFPFTKILNKFLSGVALKSIGVLNEDRILVLEFKNYQLITELFPKRPNCFLVDKNWTILGSLNPTDQATYHIPEKAKQVNSSSEMTTSYSIEAFYREQERDADFFKRKHFLENKFKRECKNLQKRLKKDEVALERALKWPEIQHEALLLQSNLYQIKKGVGFLIVADWEKGGEKVQIDLDPNLDPQEELQKRFLHVRKLKASVSHIQKELTKHQQQLLNIEKTLQSISVAQTLTDLKPFEIAPKKQNVSDSLPYREYISKSGLKIWVGKSAAKNDVLTFQYANGSDWWLHVSGFPGSHVVLKVNKGKDPDPEALQDAIQLALYYSKAKQEGSADVCITQRKYVTRFGKNVSGKVQISKHRIVHAKLDPDRFQKLKSLCFKNPV